MNLTHFLVLVPTLLVAQAALAQLQPQAGSLPTPACEKAAGAPDWLPCGPDRVLNGAELKQYIVKDGSITRMKIKGGDSGRMFFINFQSDGNMEAGLLDGPNIGKSWALQGEKVCRNYYRFFNGPQCSSYELKAGILYQIDADGSRNPVTAMEFSKK